MIIKYVQKCILLSMLEMNLCYIQVGPHVCNKYIMFITVFIHLNIHILPLIHVSFCEITGQNGLTSSFT